MVLIHLGLDERNLRDPGTVTHYKKPYLSARTFVNQPPAERNTLTIVFANVIYTDFIHGVDLNTFL
jgi:hypothetical protein